MPIAATAERVTTLIARMGGLAMLAGTLAAVAALAYRWYVRERIPEGLSLLVGLSGVAVYLNTTTVLGQVIAGSSAPTDAERALFNIAAFAVGVGGAALGRRAGDAFGADVLLGEGLGDVEGDVGRLVQSVGRVVAVELPAEIDDVTGYDPVPEATKAKLAGKTFLFPRRITVEELRKRLTQRIETDYAVGHVDVELADDGSVEFLAIGSRAAGIGPTLPPSTNAVAIRGDPAFAASAGDLVQVWETDPMRRVLTAELRGVADETVTLAIDAADTSKVDPSKRYRLVTLPSGDRPDREFASLLRAADETFSSVTVAAGSPLHGLPVGGLAVAVVAVTSEEGTTTPIPDRPYVLAPGDTVFVIARPDALRRLETAATPLDPSLAGRSEPPRASDGHSDASAGSSGSPGADAPDHGRSGPAEAFGPAASSTGSTPTSDPSEGSETDSSEGSETDRSRTGEREADGADDPRSFRELKAELESDRDGWETDRDRHDGGGSRSGGTGHGDSNAAGDGSGNSTPTESTDATESGGTGTTGPKSFRELKAELEPDEGDWSRSDETSEDPFAEHTFDADRSDSSERRVEDSASDETAGGDERPDDGDDLDDDDGPGGGTRPSE